MKWIFAWLVLITFNVDAQQGSIIGNVFYKYNEFVGNRPDAGASIVIINMATKERKTDFTADLQGNYKISNLDSGTYLVLVKSKATNEDPYLSFSHLIIYSPLIEKTTGVKIREINPELRNEIEKLNEEYTQYVRSNKIKANKIREYRSAIMDKVFDFYDGLPAEMILLGINLPTKKVSYHVVELKPNEEKSIVTDFGITYR